MKLPSLSSSSISPMLKKNLSALNSPVDRFISMGSHMGSSLQNTLSKVSAIGNNFSGGLLSKVDSLSYDAQQLSSFIRQIPGSGPISSKVDNLSTQLSSARTNVHSALDFRNYGIDQFKALSGGASLGFCSKISSELRAAISNVQAALLQGQRAITAALEYVDNLVSEIIEKSLQELMDLFPKMDWGRVGDMFEIPEGLKSIVNKLSELKPLAQAVLGEIGDCLDLLKSASTAFKGLESLVTENFDISMSNLDKAFSLVDVFTHSKKSTQNTSKHVSHNINKTKDDLSEDLSNKGQEWSTNNYYKDNIGKEFDTALDNLAEVKKELEDIKKEFEPGGSLGGEEGNEEGSKATQDAIDAVEDLIEEVTKDKDATIKDYEDTIKDIVDTIIKDLDDLSKDLVEENEDIQKEIDSTLDTIVNTLEKEQPKREETEIIEKLDTACNIGISQRNSELS